MTNQIYDEEFGYIERSVWEHVLHDGGAFGYARTWLVNGIYVTLAARENVGDTQYIDGKWHWSVIVDDGYFRHSTMGYGTEANAFRAREAARKCAEKLLGVSIHEPYVNRTAVRQYAYRLCGQWLKNTVPTLLSVDFDLEAGGIKDPPFVIVDDNDKLTSAGEYLAAVLEEVAVDLLQQGMHITEISSVYTKLLDRCTE